MVQWVSFPNNRKKKGREGQENSRRPLGESTSRKASIQKPLMDSKENVAPGDDPL